MFYTCIANQKKIRTMKTSLRTLRAKNLNSNLLNRIVGIAKSLYKTLESKLNTILCKDLHKPSVTEITPVTVLCSSISMMTASRY